MVLKVQTHLEGLTTVLPDDGLEDLDS